VIVGGLAFDANGQPSFVSPQQMIQTLAAGNANAFDAVAVHPYTDATGATAAEMATDAMTLISSVANQLVASTGPGPGGAPRQQIWVTEMGWSDQSEPASTIAAGLQDFFALLDAGARAQDNIGPVLWYDLRDNATLTSRDDQIGLRYTAANGADAGPKPAWSTFSAAAQHEGTLTLPAALTDSGPYVAPGGPGSTAGTPSSSASHASPEPASARQGLASAFAASVIHRPTTTSAARGASVCHVVVKHGKHERVCVPKTTKKASTRKTVRQLSGKRHAASAVRRRV